MTEVPEHLLRRSQERRAALGLGGTTQETGEAAALASSAAPAEIEPAAPPGATEPAIGRVVVAEPEVTEPPVPVIARRPNVPLFAVAMLVVLPVYAFIYLGAFGNRNVVAANDPLIRGSLVFRSVASCAACHGQNGEGGFGPALANVKRTFPNLADHVSWVRTGSAPFTGKAYGNSGRVATGKMPAFAGQISDADILDVVCYERVTFGGGSPAADCPSAPATGASAASSK